MMSQVDARRWNDIREVASPITGLFAPVSFAVRQGWIQLGTRNEYVDPTTGHAIPLETALAQGRIRLDSARDATSTSEVNSSLIFIERESLGWKRAEATFVLHTTTREHIPISQARDDGLIRVDANQVTWVLDVRANIWLTAEEAVSQNILVVENVLDVERVEGETEEEIQRRQQLQQRLIRAYHVNEIRPGGEPSDWLKPDEAAQLGFFNWQTGEVAVDWPARPQLHRYVEEREETRTTSSEFVVTQWCNFLTARQAGWIRLTPEHNFNKWVPLSHPGVGNANRRLLSTSVTLISNTEDFTQRQSYRYETSMESRRYHQESSSIGRQYQGTMSSSRQYVHTYAQPTIIQRELGSGSHSPEMGTEDSDTQQYLADVGEFEHSAVYELPAARETHLEVTEERTETSSLRQFTQHRSDVGRMFSTSTVRYPEEGEETEEHVSTTRRGQEEVHLYHSADQGQQFSLQGLGQTQVWGHQELQHLGGGMMTRSTREEGEFSAGPIVYSGESASGALTSSRHEESHHSSHVRQQQTHQQQQQRFETSYMSQSSEQQQQHQQQQRFGSSYRSQYPQQQHPRDY